MANFGGGNAAKKARVMADSIFDRTRRVFKKMKLEDFEQTHLQILGAEESFGSSATAEDMLPRFSLLHLKDKIVNLLF